MTRRRSRRGFKRLQALAAHAVFASFSDPVYTYSLEQGIEDGFFAPYKVVRIDIDKDVGGWRPEKCGRRFVRSVVQSGRRSRDEGTRFLLPCRSVVACVALCCWRKVARLWPVCTAPRMPRALGAWVITRSSPARGR